MRYALLNYLDESQWQAVPEDVRAGFVREFAAYHASLRKRGCFIVANRLMPAHSATSVRVGEGEREITDAPAVNTAEQFGYMLIEALDLDEAIELAAESPLARFGTVEVRPVMQMPVRIATEAAVA